MASQSNFPLLPIVASLALSGAAATGGYFTLQHWTQQQQQALVYSAGQQLAALIEQYNQGLITQSQLLAQQPNLQSSGQVRALSAPDGSVPPGISYVDQDMLNRGRTRMVPPELHLTGKTPTLDVALPMAGGGAVVIGWPAQPLLDKLKQATPPDIQLQVKQKIGADYLPLLEQNLRPQYPLQTIKVNAPNWQLSVGPTQHSPWPLYVALMLLGTGLLPLMPWLLRKQKHAPAQPAPVLPATPLDVPSASLPSAAPALADSLPPVPVMATLEPEPQPAKTGIQLDKAEPAPEAPTPEAAPESVADAPAQNLIEFTLDEPLLDLDMQLDRSFPRELFRAYDIRGPVTRLTLELVTRIGRALGKLLRDLGQSQVVVGYDARLGSPAYAEAMAEALKLSGLTVVELGLVPTPLMHFAAREHQGNGVMITASHNSGDQNGIKWIIQGQPPQATEISQLALETEAHAQIEGKGQRRSADYRQAYIDWLHQDVVLTRSFSLSLEGMNGSMGELARDVLTQMGCEVSGINLEADGHFPQGAPDPSRPDRLMDLSNDIVISGSELGLAFDGDGDRLVVLDSQGRQVSPDHLLMLFAKMVLELRPGTDVIYDVKSTRSLNSIITQAGGRPVMVATGNTIIREALLSSRYEGSFGGEFSGHYFFNDGRGLGSDDGLYAALRLLEYLDQQGLSIEDAVAALPQRVSSAEILIDYPRAQAAELLAQLAGQLDGQGNLSRIDGVRLDTAEGFALLRASNTGDHLSARFDAGSAAGLDTLQNLMADALDRVAPGLSHPLRPALAMDF